jgi:hypothetical protein
MAYWREGTDGAGGNADAAAVKMPGFDARVQAIRDVIRDPIRDAQACGRNGPYLSNSSTPPAQENSAASRSANPMS